MLAQASTFHVGEGYAVILDLTAKEAHGEPDTNTRTRASCSTHPLLPWAANLRPPLPEKTYSVRAGEREDECDGDCGLLGGARASSEERRLGGRGGGGGLQSRPDMTRSPFHAELQCLSACGDLAVVSGYGSTCQAAHTGQVE